MGQLLMELKKLQLEVSLFNQVFASAVFAIKITSIVLVMDVTWSGFGAIQLSRENALLAVSNALFSLDAVFMYNILYDRGFAIPRQFASLKELVLLKMKLKLAQGTHDAENVHRMLKDMKSVRATGVRVGEFHYLQRLSTPNFLDFCAKFLVRLVMAFRQPRIRLGIILTKVTGTWQAIVA